jgi:tetratricopeptide (TPR) repeat protein
MTRKKLFSRSAAVLFGVSLVAAVYTIRNLGFSSENFSQAAPVATQSHMQAAKYIYYQTPFYYPFKARATNLSALTPFAQNLGSMERSNSQGFRTPEYTIAHPPDTFRIIILGDSLTSGSGIPQQDAYPHVLSKLLNQECTKVRTEVIALGVGGHRLADNLIKLLVHAQYLKPDLAIFQVTSDDLEFYNYLNIYLLREVQDPYGTRFAKQQEILDENSIDWMVFHECLEQIKQWSQKTSVPVAFLMFPPIDGSRSGKNFEHYISNGDYFTKLMTPFQKILSKVQNYGPTLNLLESFRSEDEYLGVAPFSGGLNSYANGVVARALSVFLFQQNLINCSKMNIHSGDSIWQEENTLRQSAAKNWLVFNASHSQQLSFFEELQKLHPENPWVISQVAEKYRSVRQWRESYISFESLIDLSPSFAAPWFNMAMSTGKASVQIRLLKEMIQVVPDDTYAMELLARLYLKQNNKGEACRLLSNVIQIPKYEEQYQQSTNLYTGNNCEKVLGSTASTD